MREGWQSRRFLWGRLVRRDASLSPAAKLLAWALCEQFADRDTGECHPSIGTMAEAIGYGERQIKAAVKQLEEAGWLGVHRGVGRGNRSSYALRMPAGKGAEICTFPARAPAEKVNPSSAKGERECTSHIEPTSDPKARARSNVEPWHRGHLRRISPDAPELAMWATWLRASGLGTLEHYSLSSEDGGLILPLTLPPDPGDAIEHHLAVGWFNRRAAMLDRGSQVMRAVG